MGLITAGIIEIINDIFVENSYDGDNVLYILAGIILSFLGLLVHDSIRERVEENPLATDE
jgi:ABC-type polysaccharide/polyol phosphate export permease